MMLSKQIPHSFLYSPSFLFSSSIQHEVHLVNYGPMWGEVKDEAVMINDGVANL